MSKGPSPSDILNRLETDTLADLYFHDHPDQRGESKPKKQTMVSSISEAIEQHGVKNLLNSMKRDELKTVVEKVDSIDWKKEDNKNSKNVLSKKLGGVIDSQGINDFLSEHADVGLLKGICVDLDLEPASDKKEELVKQIGNAVRAIGLEGFFSSFAVDSLQDVCEDLKLKTAGSNNKRRLIECIVNKESVPEAPKKKKQKIEISKKKQPIQKGSTYEDIFQHYYVGEVREWCKENGLKTSGKKTVLIKRILAFLEGDEENTKAAPSGSKKKKKADSKGRGKAAADKENGGEEEKKEDKKGK